MYFLTKKRPILVVLFVPSLFPFSPSLKYAVFAFHPQATLTTRRCMSFYPARGKMPLLFPVQEASSSLCKAAHHRYHKSEREEKGKRGEKRERGKGEREQTHGEKQERRVNNQATLGAAANVIMFLPFKNQKRKISLPPFSETCRPVPGPGHLDSPSHSPPKWEKKEWPRQTKPKKGQFI